MASTAPMLVDEWRSVWMASGVQCVIMAGTAMMPTQCVDNWDTIMVRKIIIHIMHMPIMQL